MPNRKKIETFETIVIGGGPGGYSAALRAAQLGQDVLLVEKQNLGGACLNNGCIPSKALLEAAAIKHQISSIEKIGHIQTGVNLDIAKMHRWKVGLCEKLQNNVKSLLSRKNVTIYKGRALFSAREQLLIETENRQKRVKFNKAVLATGAQPQKIGRYKIDHKILLTLSDALLLPKLYKTLVIIGADIMGLEIATIWQKMGSRVIILSMHKNLLQHSEPEINDVVTQSLKDIGCKIFFNVQDLHITKMTNSAQIEFKSGRNIQLIADGIVVNIGHIPNTSDLNLNKVGITPSAQGYIHVDDKLRTDNPNIYAVGDIVKGKRSSYRASFMGTFVAKAISGSTANYSELNVPMVVFGDPEIVSVGFTELQAKKHHYKTITKIYPYYSYGKYITFGRIQGLTKVIINKDSNKILGVHMIGPHAFQRISESRQAVQNHLPADEMIFNVSKHYSSQMDVKQMMDVLEKNAINIFMPLQSTELV